MRSPWNELQNNFPLNHLVSQFAYQTLQTSKAALGLAHKQITNQLTDWFVPNRETGQELPQELIEKVKIRLQKLIEIDWKDAEKGIYPVDLLFEHDWEDLLKNYPLFWLDIVNVLQNIKAKEKQKFDTAIETDIYPKYYLQNFHNQTNGYLTEESANLYDLQVEILFSGSANAMRRRILAPLKKGLQQFTETPLSHQKILDIACGTGYTLQGLRAAFPKASLYGVDLSPAYLRKANKILSKISGEPPQLIRANAESLPYIDNYFQGVTSVFLFHELPLQARQNVINEAYRVLKPRGTFIICDSIQAIESPEFLPNMKSFPRIFHEPYYRHYIHDDLVKRLENAGFQKIRTTTHFMSKYWVASKE